MPVARICFVKPLLRLLLAAPLCLAVAALAAPAPPPADDGLVSIFNGKDLTGWVVEGASNSKSKKGEKAEPIWSVRDGIIRCTGDGFGFIRYDKKVDDFLFEVEYRMGPRANSGIGIRGTRFTGPAKTRPSFAAYEIQLLDDAGKPATKGSTGSLYRYVAPTLNATKPAGQWNQIRIECRGPRIRVTLNGKTVQDLDQTTVPEIKDKPLSGYVMLQSHSRPVDFRNPRLKVVKKSLLRDRGNCRVGQAKRSPTRENSPEFWWDFASLVPPYDSSESSWTVFPARCSARASSASRLNASGARAKSSSHRFCEEISSRIHPASDSCSV